MKLADKKFSNQLLLIIASFGLLILMIYLVFVKTENQLDEWFFTLISPYRNETYTGILKAITYLGNRDFLVPVNLLLVLFLLLKRNRWLAITTAVVALSSLWIMISLKSTTHRSRPVDPFIPGITNYSFPSGHAFMSVSFYGLLIWIIMQEVKEKWIRVTLITLLILLMLMIGFSRIYLRVHYVTDVVAGYCMGIIWLLGCLWLMKRIQQRPRQ